MIVLRDTVTIDAPPAAVRAWLQSLPEHYDGRHPDHGSARRVRDSARAEEGANLKALLGPGDRASAQREPARLSGDSSRGHHQNRRGSRSP